jgi:ABC-type multidrug transport system fused ATPase/permease subunit
MEALGSVSRTREEELERRYQQEGFNLIWMLIALVVQSVLTAALVVGLPMVVSALDFEGIYGMYVCVPVWFLGGLLVGMISPGKTFIEPVVASFFVAIPTVFYLVRTQTVRTMPTFMYVILAAVGVMFTLIGSYIGERIQMGPPPKAVD